ncbi:UNVERIFIED_CONTAM: protein JINGUBANG [Sesamum radiatum]|uniref:Protein JINGUBANG n=1 Tax=Sesamum radiatum TaxID=300843 RepID=A0AAW2JR04_SESRA
MSFALSLRQHQDSDQPQTNLHSDSSSNSSLTSQSSLPSVPSLTPHSQAPDHATSARYHCLATLKGHSSYVFSLALAGKHLYSGGSNGEIRVWDRNPSSLSQNYIVSEGYSAVKSMVVLGDKLFTAHHDQKSESGKLLTHPTKIQDYYNVTNCERPLHETFLCEKLCPSAQAQEVDVGSSCGHSFRTLKVWRTSDFKCIESVQNAHDDAINAVVVSNDGVVYTGSADKTIKIWKKPDGGKKHSLVSTLEKHKSAVNALALSTDGSVLYSGACDRSIIVWEKDDGAAQLAVAGALRGHKKAIFVFGRCVGFIVQWISRQDSENLEEREWEELFMFGGV